MNSDRLVSMPKILRFCLEHLLRTAVRENLENVVETVPVAQGLRGSPFDRSEGELPLIPMTNFVL